MAKVETLLAAPLLVPSRKGTSSSAQTLVNILVSIVGTGVLGLPFAFKTAGWLPGLLSVTAAGILVYYCMILLVECREKQESEYPGDIQTYGDLGGKALGNPGRYVTELLIIISQCGGAVSYLVFIGQNLSSLFENPNLNSYSSFIFILLPIEILLSFIRPLTALAPFSAFADVCNVLVMAIVLREDLRLWDGLEKVTAVRSAGGVPFAVGVAVFCYEGFGMTLALEGAMRERAKFKKMLMVAFVGITAVYACFGFLGYVAYGEETRDIVTLNLTNHWSAPAAKIGLCFALTFTFPIMLHPIHEIVEAKLKSSPWFQNLCYDSCIAEYTGVHVFRSLSVLALVVMASFIPAFGTFISLVGSTVCALVAFVLPSTFHLMFMGASLSIWRRALDIGIMVFGLVFAGFGTYNTFGAAGYFGS